MLDLYEMVDSLLLQSPGTLLVHCSAGVGRSGAFIGLFKLIKDFNNEASKIGFFYNSQTIEVIKQ